MLCHKDKKKKTILPNTNCAKQRKVKQDMMIKKIYQLMSKYLVKRTKMDNFDK